LGGGNSEVQCTLTGACGVRSGESNGKGTGNGGSSADEARGGIEGQAVGQVGGGISNDSRACSKGYGCG